MPLRSGAPINLQSTSSFLFVIRLHLHNGHYLRSASFMRDLRQKLLKVMVTYPIATTSSEILNCERLKIKVVRHVTLRRLISTFRWSKQSSLSYYLTLSRKASCFFEIRIRRVQDRPNFCYKDFILQHFKHCLLRSCPLLLAIHRFQRFFNCWNASWNALSVVARSSLIAFSCNP